MIALIIKLFLSDSRCADIVKKKGTQSKYFSLRETYDLFYEIICSPFNVAILSWSIPAEQNIGVAAYNG